MSDLPTSPRCIQPVMEYNVPSRNSSRVAEKAYSPPEPELSPLSLMALPSTALPPALPSLLLLALVYLGPTGLPPRDERKDEPEGVVEEERRRDWSALGNGLGDAAGMRTAIAGASWPYSDCSWVL